MRIPTTLGLFWVSCRGLGALAGWPVGFRPRHGVALLRLVSTPPRGIGSVKGTRRDRTRGSKGDRQRSLVDGPRWLQPFWLVPCT